MTTAQLGDDAETAFRLTMDETGTAPLTRMLAAWRVLRADPTRAVRLDDLPPTMRRVDDRVASDVPLAPITLDETTAISEAFRLSGLHRAPDDKGWHSLSNILRVMHGIVISEEARRAGSDERSARKPYGSEMSQTLRRHAMLELRNDDGDLKIRFRGGDTSQGVLLATTCALCPGDQAPRRLADQPTLGEARRQLLDMPRDLVADGTTFRIERGDCVVEGAYDASTATWRTKDGERLGRRDSRDPLVHDFHNAEWVGCNVGFPSISHAGRIFATVGSPRTFGQDDDASVVVLQKMEATSIEEALELLEGRGDLDRIFTKPARYGMMGFWLSTMEDA